MIVYTKKDKHNNGLYYSNDRGPNNIFDQEILDPDNKYIPFGILIKVNKLSNAIWAYNHKNRCHVNANQVVWTINKSLFDSEYRLVEQRINLNSQIHNLLLYKQIKNKIKTNDLLYFDNDTSDKIMVRYNKILDRIKTKSIYPDEIILAIFEYI